MVTHLPAKLSYARSIRASVSMEDWCNGSTKDLHSFCGGSNPSSSTILCASDGIGIHTSLRNWVLRVRVPPCVPFIIVLVAKRIKAMVYETMIEGSIPSKHTI